MKTTNFFSIILCLAIVLTSTQHVHAASGVWKNVMSVSNLSGLSDAYSGRMVTNSSSTIWTASIKSYTSGPAISIYLGWTYFSTTETCGGVSSQNIQGGPRSVYQSATSQSINIIKKPCIYGRIGYSNGKNEFKTSSTTKTHEWSHPESIN